MLFRALSVTGAVLLSSAAALSLPRSHDLDISPESTSHSRLLSHSRQINIPCAECSFADASCTSDIDSNTYLTLSFTTHDGILFANDDPIFPSAVPMMFHAVRHWDSGQQAVLLAYALDARPLPPQPGALLGDIFSLKLKLFDLHGRPATDHLVSLALATDSAGELLISSIQADPLHAHRPSHHHHHHHPPPSSIAFWLDRLGETVQSCWRGSSMPPAAYGKPQDDQPFPPHGHHLTNPGPQLFQPVVLPALLGVIAGVIACLLGFVVGRTAMLVYQCCRGASRRHAAAGPGVEDALVSEKQRLMKEDALREDELN